MLSAFSLSNKSPTRLWGRRSFKTVYYDGSGRPVSLGHAVDTHGNRKDDTLDHYLGVLTEDHTVCQGADNQLTSHYTIHVA